MGGDANSTSSNDLAQKKVFTTGEAAQLCKVSQQTIIRCFDSGRLQGFRVPGSRFRRIPRDELIRFMRQNGIPTDALERSRRRVLIVDDVWGSGRTSTAVKSRCESAGATPFTCVFHFNPYRSLFSRAEPNFYGAITDAYIVYPWEMGRDLNNISSVRSSPPNQ